LTAKTLKSLAFRKHRLYKIAIFNRQKDLRLPLAQIRRVIQKVLQTETADCREIYVYFVSEREIAALHGKFFNDPTPTDCISFPIDRETLGEIFVCPRTAFRYAAKYKKDPVQETILYVIHGILHLLGYDDLDPKKRRVMRKMEKKCMAYL
jgi:probable rRNA maturation factor